MAGNKFSPTNAGHHGRFLRSAFRFLTSMSQPSRDVAQGKPRASSKRLRKRVQKKSIGTLIAIESPPETHSDSVLLAIEERPASHPEHATARPLTLGRGRQARVRRQSRRSRSTLRPTRQRLSSPSSTEMTTDGEPLLGSRLGRPEKKAARCGEGVRVALLPWFLASGRRGSAVTDVK